MFKTDFEAVIRAIKLRREKDGDGICLFLTLVMPVTVDQLEELGPEVAALVASRGLSAGRLPFSKAALDQDYSGLCLDVYDVHGIKFSSQGCEARKLVLFKDKDQPNTPFLQWEVAVPPLSQHDRNFLVTALGCPARLGLSRQQPDLPLPVGANMVSMEFQGRKVRLHEGDCSECGTEGLVAENGICMACMAARAADNEGAA